MNPILKLWMFHSWCQDQVDKNEFAKSFSIFLGSFSNPEAAKKMLEGDKIASSDEDFEETTRWLKEGLPNRPATAKSELPTRKRQRKRMRNKVLE